MLATGTLPRLDNPVLRHLVAPLTDLTRWLDAHFVAHAVVGPVADAILWQPRLSRTIEVLAALPAGRAFVAAGRAYGLRGLGREGEFMHEPAQIEVRIRRPSSAAERRAVTHPLRIHLGDVAVAVVTPADLVALALESDQDVTELLAAFPDASPARQGAATHGAAAPTAILNAVC